MKNLFFITLLIGSFIFVSCGGDSEEDMKVDCSESSLQISEESTANADCGVDGSLEVSASGASGMVEFSLDGGTSQSSGIFSVSSGSYTLTATDEMGCESSVNVVVGAEPNTVVISSISSTDSGCETAEATIKVAASGGTGSLLYQLDGGAFQESGTLSSAVTFGTRDSKNITKNNSW